MGRSDRTRLYMGKVGTVLGMPAAHGGHVCKALKAIDNCWVYLNDHRGRTHYGKFPAAEAIRWEWGTESSNTFMYHRPAQALRCLVVRSHQQSDVGAALRHV